MAIEEKLISTDTIYRTFSNNSSNIQILFEQAIETPNTVLSLINNDVNSVHINNKKLIPAELCLVMKNNLKNVDFEINENGELIVNAEDSENYSIDSEGYLIYTYR